MFQNLQTFSKKFKKISKIFKKFGEKMKFFSTFFLVSIYGPHFLGLYSGILTHSPRQISILTAHEAA